MKVVEKIKYVLTVFIAVIVFLSSTGFNVYHHHCNQDKTTSTSFFIDNTSCNHAEKHHHDKPSHPSSCCEDYAASECENNYEEKECCEIVKTYHKVEIQNTDENLKKNIEFSALDIFILQSLFDFSNSDENSDEIINKESPPLLYGKELIYFIQKIKIPFRLF